jgi:hypothetical protein
MGCSNTKATLKATSIVEELDLSLKFKYFFSKRHIHNLPPFLVTAN